MSASSPLVLQLLSPRDDTCFDDDLYDDPDDFWVAAKRSRGIVVRGCADHEDSSQVTSTLRTSRVSNAFNQPIDNRDISSTTYVDMCVDDNGVDDCGTFCVASKRADATGCVLLSDFAGIDVPGLGLAALGVLQKHFAFEIDPVARKFISDNFNGVSLFGWVLDRGVSDACGADVVTAGFPCQPFSLLGLQQGWDDQKGRGRLVSATLTYVLRERPRLVLFENVAAFVRPDNRQVLQRLLDMLTRDDVYKGWHRVLCTSANGLPQTRRRWFLVAVRSDCVVSDFVWPEALEMLPLSLVLGPRSKGASSARRPGVGISLATRNVDTAVGWLLARNPAFARSDYIIDCDASANWCGKPSQCCPCLTRSRPQGLWNISRGERISAAACMRLQGVCTEGLVLPDKDGQVRNLAGNAMSLCVVERLLRAALVAAGSDNVDLPDRWGAGVAQAAIVREAWGVSPPQSAIDRLPHFVARHFEPRVRTPWHNLN